jgi:hypothetical protein
MRDTGHGIIAKGRDVRDDREEQDTDVVAIFEASRVS